MLYRDDVRIELNKLFLLDERDKARDLMNRVLGESRAELKKLDEQYETASAKDRKSIEAKIETISHFIAELETFGEILNAG